MSRAWWWLTSWEYDPPDPLSMRFPPWIVALWVALAAWMGVAQAQFSIEQARSKRSERVSNRVGLSPVEMVLPKFDFLAIGADHDPVVNRRARLRSVGPTSSDHYLLFADRPLGVHTYRTQPKASALPLGVA